MYSLQKTNDTHSHKIAKLVAVAGGRVAIGRSVLSIFATPSARSARNQRSLAHIPMRPHAFRGNSQRLFTGAADKCFESTNRPNR